MIGTAKNKSFFPPALSALWTILFLVVALFLPETRVWGFEITHQPASGVFESVTPSSIGENYDGCPYDASDSLLASKAAKGGMSLAGEMAVLRQAKTGKGNFGVGSASSADAARLGNAWVGNGSRVASDGRTLVSADGLRTFRPPSAKPNSPYATKVFKPTLNHSIG